MMLGLIRGASGQPRSRAKRTGLFAFAALVCSALLGGQAFAAPSVQWTSPADGGTYLVGTEVAPDGRALGTDSGDGLDLVLVLDASGSMGRLATSGGVTKTRQQWQRDAAIALVNSLPTTNTSVSIVYFNGTTGTTQLNLTPTTSKDDIIAAINAVPASGVTPTAAGIDQGTAQLLGDNATAGRSKQMVVVSDGLPNRSNRSGLTAQQAAEAAAIDAALAGITVHGVVIPGGAASSKEAIVNAANNATDPAGGGIFVDFSNPDDLSGIEDFFSAGGGFVGLANLDITLPDGTVLNDYPTDAFGNFKIDPSWAMQFGNNTFIATATFEDGSERTASLNLIGVTDQPPSQVPTPGALVLLLSGLGLLSVARRRGAV